MGAARNKLIEDVDGRPLLHGPVEALRNVLGNDVLVVLGHESDRVREALDPEVVSVEHADWEEGMGSSISQGVRTILASRSDRTPRGILICVGDLPGLEASVVQALVEAFPVDAPSSRICVPTNAAGRDGHPVLFGADYFEALCALSGDRGARPIIDAAGAAVIRVRVKGDGILRDIDTPDDLADWQR